MNWRFCAILCLGLLPGFLQADITTNSPAVERVARLNRFISELDSVNVLLASNQCQAVQNRLAEIAAAFDECTELEQAPRICEEVGPLIKLGKLEDALFMLDNMRIAVTNSIVLSVQVSRLQTQLCGVVVADLEAKRMNVYKYYIAALDRLNQCRDQRDAARSQWDKLKKKREAEKATVAKNDLLELQIKQAEKAYEDALAAITKAEAEFHKVMRVHARAFAQLGLGNSMLAEYQDMLVNAEFSVAGGPRIRHEPRRIEEIARAPESTEVLAAAKAAPPPPPPAPPDFFTQYRWWIVGGIGAVVLVAVAFAFAKK